jgi:hypothetical protein
MLLPHTTASITRFIAITRHLVFKISDVCVMLSRSDGTMCHALRVRPSVRTLQRGPRGAVLYPVLFRRGSRVVASQAWASRAIIQPRKIFHEVLDSGVAGSIDDQIKEIAADGYSAFFVLTQLIGERPSGFLPFLKARSFPSAGSSRSAFSGVFHSGCRRVYVPAPCG